MKKKRYNDWKARAKALERVLGKNCKYCVRYVERMDVGDYRAYMTCIGEKSDDKSYWQFDRRDGPAQ